MWTTGSTVVILPPLLFTQVQTRRDQVHRSPIRSTGVRNVWGICGGAAYSTPCTHKPSLTHFPSLLPAPQLGFDAKDPHIASCKNNLAEFYRNTRQYDKAEKLYIEVGVDRRCD